jgi:hypothetical protein
MMGRFAWRMAGIAATLAAGALLALTIAHWGWHWFGPKPRASVEQAVDAPPSAIVAAAPFGRARPAAAGAPAAPGLAAPARAMELRLLGVFAGRNGDGYALLRLDHGAVLVRRGDEIAPGARLEAVFAGAIRIRERGQTRDIELRPSAAPAVAPAVAPSVRRVAATDPRGARAGCAPPAGFTGPVYRLNAELLTGLGARPESWSAALAPAPGGLAVRDETGLAAMLGMKPGDRLVQANGIALASIDDVLSAVVKPLVASQPVRLVGSRDGTAREWLFVNAGACGP